MNRPADVSRASPVEGRRSSIVSLTESEAAALAPLLGAAVVMTAAWLADSAGLAIDSAAVLVVMLLSVVLGFLSLTRHHGTCTIWFSTRRLAGFLLIVAMFAGYICWLAWPSFLPVTQGPDLVHHLSLVHFIQRRHALPHGQALGGYLGEMVSYTPGSHVLAALMGDWLRVDAVRLIHPLQAAAVALKAGLIYTTLARIHSSVLAGRHQEAVFPAPAARPDASAHGSAQTDAVRDVAPAFAGTLLLLLPYRYLLEPIVVFGFYSQVVAETFAVAMLWAAVAWHQQPSRLWLSLSGIFGVAVVLSWPVYFAAPALGLAVVVLLHWWRGERSTGRALVDLVAALGPGALTIAIFSARNPSSAGILRSGGSVLVPGVDVFGWPFLLLAAGGLVVAIRHARHTAPVLAFAAACAAQILALAILQTRLGATNLYLANKMVFLLVCPVTIMAALALAVVARAALALDTVARNFSSASAGVRKALLVTAVMTVVVVLLLSFAAPPLRPLASPITEPVYRAGTWARTHVPGQCVDYFVDHWITGYWLHLDVLGNARATERMRTETFEYRAAVSRWILPGGLPYGIVENVAAVPVDARHNMTVLHRSGRAAVVRRADGLGVCTDRTLPIDRLDGARAR